MSFVSVLEAVVGIGLRTYSRQQTSDPPSSLYSANTHPYTYTRTAPHHIHTHIHKYSRQQTSDPPSSLYSVLVYTLNTHTIHTHTHPHTYTHIHIHTQSGMYVCLLVFGPSVHTQYTHNTHTYTPTYIYTHTYTHAVRYVCVPPCIRS